MRDEVLIKRQLVAMVTWVLANKRVREKCLLADGKKRGTGEKREGTRLRATAELNTIVGQSNQARNASMLPFRLHPKGDSGDHHDPPLFSKVDYASLRRIPRIITC